MHNVEQQLEIVKDGIRMDAPLVAHFFDVATPLGPYAEALYQYQAPSVHRERQRLLKKVIRSLLAETFTEEEIARAQIDWESDMVTNIVDHHGLWNHPLIFAVNVIGNMHRLPTKAPRGVVVLSDSGVPMNNFFHKRGLKFHGKQLNIIPSRDRHAIAYAMPPLPRLSLVQAAQQQGIAGEALAFLDALQEETEAIMGDTSCTSWSAQVQRVNAAWWKKLFAKDVREYVPELLYVPNERVAARLLPEYWNDDAHLFSRILFDPEWRRAALKMFEGVTGCWGARGRGSQFFWALDDAHRAVPLHLDGDVFTAPDGALRIPCTRDALTAALSQMTIYPTMFLVYGIAVFHCGVKPLVGYGSMNYQTAMKKAWERFLAERDPEEAARIGAIPTDGFVGGPKVTYVWDGTRFQDLWALDIIERGGLSAAYLDHLRHVQFRDVLIPALIDVYDSYVRPEHKQKITITSNDLMGAAFDFIKRKV